MSAIAALLALPVGAVFVWSGAAKAVSDPGRLEALALTHLLRDSRAAALVLRILGGSELCIGSVMLLSPSWVWPRWAALGIAAGGAMYMAVALRLAPGTSCGCFGTATSKAVSAGTAVRGLSLAAAAGVSLTTTMSWTN